jgi:hypothetical protein
MCPQSDNWQPGRKKVTDIDPTINPDILIGSSPGKLSYADIESGAVTEATIKKAIAAALGKAVQPVTPAGAVTVPAAGSNPVERLKSLFLGGDISDPGAVANAAVLQQIEARQAAVPHLTEGETLELARLEKKLISNHNLLTIEHASLARLNAKVASKETQLSAIDRLRHDMATRGPTAYVNPATRPELQRDREEVTRLEAQQASWRKVGADSPAANIIIGTEQRLATLRKRLGIK